MGTLGESLLTDYTPSIHPPMVPHRAEADAARRKRNERRAIRFVEWGPLEMDRNRICCRYYLYTVGGEQSRDYVTSSLQSTNYKSVVGRSGGKQISTRGAVSISLIRLFYCPDPCHGSTRSPRRSIRIFFVVHQNYKLQTTKKKRNSGCPKFCSTTNYKKTS